MKRLRKFFADYVSDSNKVNEGNFLGLVALTLTAALIVLKAFAIATLSDALLEFMWVSSLGVGATTQAARVVSLARAMRKPQDGMQGMPTVPEFHGPQNPS